MPMEQRVCGWRSQVRMIRVVTACYCQWGPHRLLLDLRVPALHAFCLAFVNTPKLFQRHFNETTLYSCTSQGACLGKTSPLSAPS